MEDSLGLGRVAREDLREVDLAALGEAQVRRGAHGDGHGAVAHGHGDVEAVGRRRREGAELEVGRALVEARGLDLVVDLGRKRVIQRRFNVSVPRARVPEKASTLRDRSER